MSEASQPDLHPGSRLGVRRGIRSLMLRLFPEHVYVPLRLEIPLVLIRLKKTRVQRRYQHSDNLLVNVGAGLYGKPGWVNIDVSSGPSVNCVYDCRKSLPFQDESVRGIFCEHFFEHIDYAEEVPYFLRECHRVLKKKGVLRVIVPDAEKYLRAYCGGGWEELSRIRPLDAEHADFWFHCKYNTPFELINAVFRQGQEHKFAYDFETLRFVLCQYGFSTVVRQEYGHSVNPELCLDQAVRASESLYVDGTK